MNTLRKVCKNTSECAVLIRRDFPYKCSELSIPLYFILGLKEMSVKLTKMYWFQKPWKHYSDRTLYIFQRFLFSYTLEMKMQTVNFMVVCDKMWCILLGHFQWRTQICQLGWSHDLGANESQQMDSTKLSLRLRNSSFPLLYATNAPSVTVDSYNWRLQWKQCWHFWLKCSLTKTN